MRVRVSWVLASVLFILATVSPPLVAQQRTLGVAPAQRTEQRVALVIGNAAYKSVPLANPVNDAIDVAARLKTLGFEVIERRNLSKNEVGATLREFRSKLKPGAVALFFYAGHGLQLKGVNYLPTVDADIASEEDVPMQSLDANKVLEIMDEGKTRLNLVFLDACRNNPYARSFRSAADGLARINAPSGTIISFATRPGSVAADGRGRNGLYTEHLLRAMNATDLPIEQVLKRVVSGVKGGSKGRQEPWMEGSIEGDFCFGVCGGAQVASAAPAAAIAPLPSAPSGGGMSLDDIAKQQQSRAQWSKWQAKMKADYKKVLALNAAPDLQAAAWGRFLASYAEENPFGGEDAELRAEAATRKQAAEAESAKEKEEVENRRREAARQRDEADRKRREATRVALAPTTTGAIQQASPAGAISAAGAGRSFRDCNVCPEMVVIPAGSFTMGSPASEPQRDADEGPQHEVRISRSFAAGTYEVTFDEWDACVRENGCSNRAEDRGWGRGRRPVINVSWNDAKQYTEWLSRKTGKSYRLLSEAQWEYVARAGTTTAFSFGNSITPQLANYDSKVSYAGSPTASNQGKTVAVGSYAPNGFGLYDVHGNVWEWTEDCSNGSYNGAPTDGSAWTSGNCGRRVQRGGSWHDYPRDLRSALRSRGDPSNRSFSLGLRVSRTD